MAHDRTTDRDAKAGAAPLPGPFEYLARMRTAYHESAGHSSVDGSMAEDLLQAAEAIERVHGVAAEIQLGYESFDNTARARLYGGLQERLLTAARELVGCCGVLLNEHEKTWRREHGSE
jgi:hypothetical protein